jgi:hypothetical protein
VDISIGEAVRRADARYRGGHEDYGAGIGFGGRYVPPEVIEAQADPEWGSRNRRAFEQVKPRFTGWAIYDNLVTGRDPEYRARPRRGAEGGTVSEVTGLINCYKAGEMAAQAQQGPGSDVPGSFDDVEAVLPARAVT